MKDYTVRRYSLSDLTGEARERAIKGMQNSLYESMDERELTQFLKEIVGDELGSIPAAIEIAYSLSNCQGDGVALYGSINKAEAKTLDWTDRVESVSLIRNSWGNHYSHYYSFDVELFDGEGEEIELTDTIIETQLRDLCQLLERKGYGAIDDEQSEESAIARLMELDSDSFLESGAYSPPEGVLV